MDEAIYTVQTQIRTHSQQLAKQIEASLGLRRQLEVPPISQSVVGGLNPTADLYQPLSLPLGGEHPGTLIRRSERLAAKAGTRRYDDGAPVDRTGQLNYSLDFRTREPAMAPILHLPPRPRAYSGRRGMDVTISYVLQIFIYRLAYAAHIESCVNSDSVVDAFKVCPMKQPLSSYLCPVGNLLPCSA